LQEKNPLQKVTLIYCLILCGAISSIGQKIQGDSWAKAKEQGKGTITAVYYQSPGLIEKGQVMSGVCVELINKFIEFVQHEHRVLLTVNYEKEELVFSTFLEAIKNSKNVLGVANVTITEERKKLFLFTPSYLNNVVVMVTHKNAPNINNLNEMPAKYSGYSLVVIKGSSHMVYVEKMKKIMPSLKVSYGSSGSEIMPKIVKDPKVFTIQDLTEFMDKSRQNLPIKMHGITYGAYEEFGFIMSKDSDWMPLWNQFLTKDYKKSIEYKKIISDNLGSNFLPFIE
jgi:membrane-bound lytic murein transglycosylase MltF